MYGFLPFSLRFICLFFSSQDQCERGMEYENDKKWKLVERDINCSGDGETREYKREYTAAENMKEEILCPLYLLWGVINLQILLPSISGCNPFCSKGKLPVCVIV